MEDLPLFQNKKERFYFLFFILVIFTFNIFLQYKKFQEFKYEEVFQTDATIINIYPKQNYQVLKIQTDNLVCFTSTSNTIRYKKFQNINLYLLTKKISFLEYLKGFYTKNFNLTTIDTPPSNKHSLISFIQSQHVSQEISSLYSSLFLAVPIDANLRDTFSSYGISHLIAISGFHLGIISFVLYFLLHIIYSSIHQNYFPYRNKRFDLMLIVSIILFGYLVFVNIVPSLLRSFVMFIFGLFLLRNNIKLFSFETLLIIVLIILALFPKLLFSLSLWFSVVGVFYIYLFIQYFKDLNRYFSFILFNFWIYLAINPIVHHFFATTSLEQLYSPILTILFTIFYPLSLFLHLITYGGLLDPILTFGLNFPISSYDKFTPSWFFVLYIVISFLSIISKKLFIVLNILFTLFTFWLFIF
jgi:competence protein ComEC